MLEKCLTINNKHVLEILGESNSGKTVFAMDLCANYLIQETNLTFVEQISIPSKIIYFDLSASFCLLRFVAILESKLKFVYKDKKLKDLSKLESVTQELLKGICLVKCNSSEQLLYTLHSLEAFIKDHDKLSLIVIDDFTAYYWLDISNTHPYVAASSLVNDGSDLLRRQLKEAMSMVTWDIMRTHLVTTLLNLVQNNNLSLVVTRHLLPLALKESNNYKKNNEADNESKVCPIQSNQVMKQNKIPWQYWYNFPKDYIYTMTSEILSKYLTLPNDLHNDKTFKYKSIYLRTSKFCPNIHTGPNSSGVIWYEGEIREPVERERNDTSLGIKIEISWKKFLYRIRDGGFVIKDEDVGN